MSTPDFTGSGRSHRRAPGQDARPRYDSPRGDVYGESGYRTGARRSDNGYPPRARQAGDGRAQVNRAQGNGYDRAGGDYGGENERFGPRGRDGYGRGNGYPGNGGGRRGYDRAPGGRPSGPDGYGRGGNGPGRRDGYGSERYGRDDYGRDDYGRDDYGRDDYERAGSGARHGGSARASGYGRTSGAGPAVRPGRDWDEETGPAEGGRHGPGRRGKARTSGRSARRSSRGEYGDGGGGNGGGRGGRGGRPKRKGDWWRHWTWKKAVAVVLATGGGLVVAVAAWIGVAYASTQIPTDVSQMALQQASTVYFSNGKSVVGRFGTIDRQVLTYNQIPAQLRNAVLAAEDRNFYNEGGISPTGIMRAAYEDITGSGDALQGGSTITQQFVRNYYASIGTQQTVSRKIKEIFVAEKLAREKSKAWILTQYLNTIYFGDGAYGVEAAAETFFGKPVGKLDVAQDAMIAAMLNAPGQFDPTPGSAGYDTLVARWKYVLQGMVAMHNLSPAESSAQKFPKVVSAQQAQTTGWTGYNGYIMQAVQNELETLYHYTPREIDNDGLRIVTTFSQSMMNSLYATVKTEEHQMAEAGTGTALPSFAHIGAVLEQPGTGAIVAMYAGPSYSESAKYCQKIYCQLNMALTNREQVGSSFKPYVLSAARAKGMSVKTSILDGTSPLCVPSDQYPQVYSVPATSSGQSGCPSTPYGWHAFTNDEGDGATGPQTVLNATAQSLNTAYTDLTHRVGTQNVINMAKSFGVNVGAYADGGSNLQADEGEVGIALGQNSLTVGEQASTFATIDNDGEYNTPHVIKQIIRGNAVVASKVTHHQVLTPAEDSDVEYALSQTTLSGTGTNAEMSDGRPMIGKTGTTSTAQSAFFLGAIPQYSLAVGIFTNQQNASTAANAQTLNNLGGLGGYGGDWPALIWRSFAQKNFLQLPVEQLPTPDFGGTEWNLMGPVQTTTNPHPHASHTQPAPQHSHPAPTCTPSPLNNDCQGGGGGTPPPSTTPPPSSGPPPTCNPARPHCQPSGLSTQQAVDQSASDSTSTAADRARSTPLSRGG